MSVTTTTTKDPEKGNVDFGDVSTIHGIPEIWHAKNGAIRVMWIVIFLGSLAGMSYQLYELAQHYEGEPLATSFSKTFPRRWPAVTICPTSWMDSVKTTELNLTAELIHSLTSFLAPGIVNQFSMYKPDESSFNANLQAIQSLVDTRFGSIDALYEYLAYDRSRISDLQNPSMTPHHFMTQRGMCYQWQNEQTFSKLNVSNALQFMSLYETDLLNIYKTFLDDLGFSPQLVFLGEKGFNKKPYNEIALPYGFHVFVHMQFSQTERPNLNRLPCKEWTEWERIDCLLKCEQEGCLNADSCEPYLPGTNQTNLSTLCTTALESRICEMDSETEANCEQKCPDRCVEEIFQAVVTPYSEIGYDYYDYDTEMYTEPSIIVFALNDPLSSTLTRQDLILTPSSMISQVGGTISLWCGASILSLIELILHVGWPALWKIKK